MNTLKSITRRSLRDEASAAADIDASPLDDQATSAHPFVRLRNRSNCPHWPRLGLSEQTRDGVGDKHWTHDVLRSSRSRSPEAACHYRSRQLDHRISYWDGRRSFQE